MKYEKPAPVEAEADFDRLIDDALNEVQEKEIAEFLASDTEETEISEELDRRICALIEKKTAREGSPTKYYPKLLSSAALVTFVCLGLIWAAMMNAFSEFPWNGVELPTDSPAIQAESSQNGGADLTGQSGKQPGLTPTHGEFIAPPDEQKTVFTVTQTNADGVCMKISVSGYRSESLGKEFYLKSNEYVIIDVEIQNLSSEPFYRIVPTDCAANAPDHLHDASLELSCNGYPLCSSSVGFDCGKTFVTEPVKTGETYRYRLKYAAGTAAVSGFDLPADGNAHAGIKLYDKTLYPDGSCVFSGFSRFSYCKTASSDIVSFSQPLNLEFVYVSSEKSAYSK